METGFWNYLDKRFVCYYFRDCVSSQDPYCVWSKVLHVCQTLTYGDMASTDSYIQDVIHGNTSHCPPGNHHVV